VVELYRTMADGAGVDADPVFAPARTGELERSSLDPGRAQMQLGWKPWTDLPDGTSAVLRWFKDRKTAP
jgi:UDP-glucose 4-epimerase